MLRAQKASQRNPRLLQRGRRALVAPRNSDPRDQDRLMSSWSSPRTLFMTADHLIHLVWEKSGFVDVGFLLLFMTYIMAALVSGQVFNYVRGVHPFGVSKGEDAFVIIHPDKKSQFLAESYVAGACFWFLCNSFLALLNIGGDPLQSWTEQQKMVAQRRPVIAYAHLAVIFTSLVVLQSMTAVKMKRYPFGAPMLLKYIWDGNIHAF